MPHTELLAYRAESGFHDKSRLRQRSITHETLGIVIDESAIADARNNGRRSESVRNIVRRHSFTSTELCST